MKNEPFVYTTLPNMTVGMQCQQDHDLRMMRGKALLNQAENRLLFMQNTPRGPRSHEMMRTAHARLVRTPQGRCTLTFRFSLQEQGLGLALVDEMIKVVKKELSDNQKKE